MSWALLSISAAFLWAVGNIIDKSALTKWKSNPMVPVVVFCIVGLPASLLIFLFRGFSGISAANIFLALSAGVFYFFAQIFYYKAAKMEEISRIIPLVYLAPLFVLILATIFFGEIFSPIKYLGIFLLLIGAMLVSAKNFTKIRPGPAFWLAVLSALMLAFTAVLQKYLLDFTDFWTIFSFVRIGTFISLIPAFIFYSKDFSFSVNGPTLKSIGFFALSSTLGMVALLFFTIATALGYVTLTTALTSVQPFFTLVLATTASHFFPSILKEEIHKSMLAQKILAIALIIAGTIFIIQ